MIREELEQFTWTHATWTRDKLLAASPFRSDHHPSFMVWLRDNPATGARAGDWADRGASNPEYARGSFVKLLAFLRQESEEDTREYLRWKYGDGDEVNPDALTLDLSGTLRLPERPHTLDIRMLDEYSTHHHPYLTSRGISAEVQAMMRTGFSPRHNAVTIPWFNVDGSLANVKYRRVRDKSYWYVKNGSPIRSLLYGMDVIYRKKEKWAVIVEAEIDAMFVCSAYIPAIAVGGSEFTVEKAEIIKRSPLEEIVILADHDEAGQKMKRKVIELLAGYVRVKVAGYPMRYKDANEVGDLAELREYIDRAKTVGLRTLD